MQQSRTFTPEDFGARGDGVSDDYPAFRALAAAVSRARRATVTLGAGKVYLLNRFKVEGPRSNGVTNIYWDKIDQLTLDFNGSTVAVKGDFHRPADLGGPASSRSAVSPFMFRNCQNLVIQNGELDGRVYQSSRDPAVSETDSIGIGLYNCHNVVIRKMNIHHWQCDGIYLAADQYETNTRVCENITIIECRSWANARQGLSNAGAANVRSTASHYDRTGLTNRQGTAPGKYIHHPPGAGVDIEPSVGPRPHNRLSDWTSEGDSFYRNLGAPFAASYEEHTTHAILNQCTGESYGSKDGRIQMHVPMGVINGGRWKNVTVGPGVGVVKARIKAVTIISNARFEYDDPERYAVYDNNSWVMPESRYRNNVFILKPTAPYKIVPFLCDQRGHNFIGNDIFISASAFNGKPRQMIASFITAGTVADNKWRTDRGGSAANGFFVDYQKARDVSNESYTGALDDGGSDRFRKR